MTRTIMINRTTADANVDRKNVNTKDRSLVKVHKNTQHNSHSMWNSI